MSSLKVYLAGDVSDFPWRQTVMRECADLLVEWLCPIDGHSYATLAQANSKHTMFHVGDALKLKRADVVFAYFRKDSPSRFSGTSWECGVAYALGKPTIVVNDMGDERTLYELVRRWATAYSETLGGGIDLLRELALEMAHEPGRER